MLGADSPEHVFSLEQITFLYYFPSSRMRFSGFHFYSMVQIIKRYGFVIGNNPRALSPISGEGLFLEHKHPAHNSTNAVVVQARQLALLSSLDASEQQQPMPSLANQQLH